MAITCLTGDAWYVPAITIHCIITVFYVQHMLLRVLVIAVQMASCVVFFVLHVREHVHCCTMQFWLLHVLWPQLLLYASFFVSTFHYQETLSKLRETNQLLDASSNAKSTFLCAIGHEIRTPLHAIIGSAEVLLSKSNNKAAGHQEQSALLQTILTAGNALLASMNGVLNLISLDSKKGMPQKVDEKQEVKLNDVLKEIIEMSHMTCNNPLVHVDHSLSESATSTRIKTHVNSLKTICMHLVCNAIKFTPQGSVQVHASLQGDKCIVEVVDTGIGISTEFLQKSLFQPFSQQDDRMQRNYTGAGLGLAVSQALASAMGGTISVKSAEGKGSTFVLEIPVEIVQEKLAQQKTKTGQRILVCDDNPVNVKVMCKMMQLLQHNVDAAFGGSEALEKIHSTQYDAVFMDLQMPGMTSLYFADIFIGMNGLECASLIRKHFHGTSNSNCKIILVTGAEVSTLQDSQLESVDSVYQKPLQFEQLKHILASI